MIGSARNSVRPPPRRRGRAGICHHTRRLRGVLARGVHLSGMSPRPGGAAACERGSAPALHMMTNPSPMPMASAVPRCSPRTSQSACVASAGVQ